MQSIDSIETYAYGTSKDLVSDKEKIKCNNIIQKTLNFDDVIKEETKEHNLTWAETPDHPYIILIYGGSGSGKTNSLFNLINQQPDTDKIYLYTKDLNEAKYQL